MATVTSLIFPDPSSIGVSLYAEGGVAELVSLEAYRLANAFLSEADLNEDGIIDSVDVGILLENWGTSTTPDLGELDGTPPVDSLDLGILLAAWGSAPLSAAAVPEPSPLVALAGAIVCGLAARRRQPYGS